MLAKTTKPPTVIAKTNKELNFLNVSELGLLPCFESNTFISLKASKLSSAFSSLQHKQLGMYNSYS